MREFEKRTFQDGGCIISFSIGFLESSYFDKQQKKMVYKNGFADVKKKFTAQGKPEYLENSLVAGTHVLIEGRLGFEEWQDKNTNAKRSRITIVADRVSPITAEQGSTGNGNRQSNSRQSAPKDDDNGFGDYTGDDGKSPWD